MVRNNAYIIGYDGFDEDGEEAVSTAEVGGRLEVLEEALQSEDRDALRDFETINESEIWIYKLVPVRHVTDEA